MSSKLTVKLVDLEVKLPSVEVLLKKYGKFLVQKVKHVPKSAIGNGDQFDMEQSHQLHRLDDCGEEATVIDAFPDPSNTSTELHESSGSESEVRGSSCKQNSGSGKLVLGRKLLQKRKSRKRCWRREKKKSPLQKNVSPKLGRELKQESKLDVPQVEDATLSNGSKALALENQKLFQDLKTRAENETVKSKNRVILQKKTKDYDSVSEERQVKVEKKELETVISGPLASTSKSSQHSKDMTSRPSKVPKITDSRMTEKNAQINVKACSPEVMETIAVDSISNNTASNYRSKLKGGPNTQFSLKFKELSISLCRIDDHPLRRDKKVPNLRNHSNYEEYINEEADDWEDPSQDIPSSSASSLVGDSKNVKDSNVVESSLFQEKLDDITLILSQSFKCDCGLDYTSQESLISHSVDVHRNGSGSGVIYNYKCKFCDVLFQRWSSRKKHEHRFHNISKPAPITNPAPVPARLNLALCKLSCELCGEVFLNQSNLRLHRALSHEVNNILHKCQVCNEEFKSEDLLQSHRQVHVSQPSKLKNKDSHQSQHKVHKCTKCENRFNTVVQLKLHDKAKHAGGHRCELCDATYSKKFELNRHIKLQHGVTEKQWNVRQQIQRKRPGPKSKTCGKSISFSLTDPFQEFSTVHLPGSEGASNSLEYNTYAKNESLKFDEVDDDDIEDPLEDPLQIGEENDTRNDGHKDFSGGEGETYHSTQAVSVEQQPSLLALLEGADPNDPSYYAENSGETVTLNYVPENIKCPHCTKTFTDAFHLKQHSVVHFARITKPYICLFPDCSERFDSSANLQRHRQKSHSRNPTKLVTMLDRAKSDDQPAAEPIVNEEVPVSSNNQNQEEKSEREEYKCKICGEEFTRLSAFVKHEWSHAAEEPISRQYCNSRFRNKNSFRMHIERHISKGSPLIAQNAYSTRKDTNKPKFLVRLFKCQFCAATFQSLRRYTRHVATHKSSSPCRYNCQYCSRSFKTRNGFMAHIYTHTKRAPFRCRVCQKTFKSVNLLNIHRKTHVNVYSCSYCNKKFDRKNAFEGHLVLHSKEKLFSCQLCFENFYRKQTLLIHIRRTHSKNKHSKVVRPKEQRQPVEFLQKYEITKNEIQKMSAAIDKKVNRGKYPCCYCAETYQWKKQLQQHQEIHKIHRCSLCPKKYLQLHGLVMHVHAAHNERIVFRCEPCDKSFLKNCQLKRHYARKNHLDRIAKINNQLHEASMSSSSLSNDYDDPPASPMQIPTEEILPATQEQTTSDSFAMSAEDSQWSVPVVMESCGALQFIMQVETSPSHACSQCSALFTSSQELCDHVSVVHSADPDRVVTFCKPCNRIFLSLNDFSLHTCAIHGHEKRVTGTKKVASRSNTAELTLNGPGTSKKTRNENKSGRIKGVRGRDITHIQQCSADLCVTCWTCGSLFTGIVNLADHMETQHKSYTCPYDGTTFRYKSKLFYHFNTHTSKEPCHCNNCKMTPHPNPNESIHPKNMNPELNLEPADAADDYITIVDDTAPASDDDDIMILEERITKPDDQIEPNAVVNTSRAVAAKPQARFVDVPVLTHCVTCRQKFLSRKTYEAHACHPNWVHPDQPEETHPFKCGMCTKTFMHEETLGEHAKMHQHLMCLVSKMNLGQAKASSFTSVPAARISAPATTAAIRSPPSAAASISEFPSHLAVTESYVARILKKHMAQCKPAGPASLHCDKCYRKFKTISDLGSHKKSYTHVAAHFCPFCRNRFAYKDFLSHMELEHPGDKIYSCSNICQTHFRTAGSLTRHMNSTQHITRLRMHELYLAQQLMSGNSVLEYECPECKTGFSSEVLVVDHMVNSRAYQRIADPSHESNDSNIYRIEADVVQQESSNESSSSRQFVLCQDDAFTCSTDPVPEVKNLQTSDLRFDPTAGTEEDVVESNVEEEQETDIIWSSPSENEEDDDDTPVFKIVTHAPL